MHRVRGLGLPAPKSGEGAAGLRRSAPLELMDHGGPAADPQVSADLSTVRVWNRRILAGKLELPLEPCLWDSVGRRPIARKRQRADTQPKAAGRSAWLVTSRRRLDLPRSAWDSAQVLCAQVASTRRDFDQRAWLPAEARKTGRLGGVWHEERAHSAFQVGDTCVRCGEAVENHEQIVHHCPHWNKETRESGLPTHAQEAPACVRLHSLLPTPPPGALPAHEPALVMSAGAHTVWTDGFGRHSSNPHFRKCGVGYVTDTGERSWRALPGCRQSVFRAQLLTVARALEECQPRRVVSDCKGVVKAIQSGHRLPKGRHRDLEARARNALSCRLRQNHFSRVPRTKVTRKLMKWPT
eukprot:230580-Amphidinium_carterae.2